VHSNSYTLRYAIFFTAGVAIILALAASSLRPLQQQNIAQAKRASILQSVMTVNTETLEQDYNTFITERVFGIDGQEKAGESAFTLDLKKEMKQADDIRRFPLYVFNKDGQTRYIIPLQGKGLWGPISAFLALDADLNTISGVIFEHEKKHPVSELKSTQRSSKNSFKGNKSLPKRANSLPFAY